MVNERWDRLAEQQGIAYAKTVAEAMNLKLDMDNPADREKLRRAVLDLFAGGKMRKQNPSLTISAQRVGIGVCLSNSFQKANDNKGNEDLLSIES